MEWVSSSGGEVELDVDLESGGTTSEEDATQSQDLRADRFSKLIHSEGDGKVMNSDKTYYGTSQDKKIDKEKHKKKKPIRPWKPPRPPGGPCLGAPYQKLFTEISELNLKRKRMERIRMLRKLKMEKPLSLNRNLVPCLVTIIFFLVIIYEGNSLLIFPEIGVCLRTYHPPKTLLTNGIYWASSDRERRVVTSTQLSYPHLPM